MSILYSQKTVSMLYLSPSNYPMWFIKGQAVLSKILTEKYPWVQLAHAPTPLERMNNLSRHYSSSGEQINLWIKRDDCTGLAMGGNKARQLEFYLGEAVARNADTILTTGAIQSNQVRMTVAAAHKLGMQAEVQLEERVSDRPSEYYQSGNPFLLSMMGATVHKYPVGEDEEGADRALYELADKLAKRGRTPYVIPLAPNHTPLGALAYALVAEELLKQLGEIQLDAVVIASGSGSTHSGLLCGLRALNCQAKVYGICIRRNAELQKPRLFKRCQEVARMLDDPNLINETDILVDDCVLNPGYGHLNPATIEAITNTGKHEGILLDPTYSGKAMAGMFDLIKRDVFKPGENIVFLHTGGVPGAFGYPELYDLKL